MDIIESLNRKSDELKRQIRRLEEMSNAVIDFNKRYADFINSPEGYFGVFSDEIIVLVMSYCEPKYIIMPLCKRLYNLCNESLKLKFEHITRDYDHFAIAYCIDIIFDSCVKFYYYLFRFHNIHIKVDPGDGSLIIETKDTNYVIHKDQTIDITISDMLYRPIKITELSNIVKICCNDINIVFGGVDYFIHTQYKGANHIFGAVDATGKFEEVYESFVKKHKKSS